jgi:NAD(P)-dependent dehydrogenase (short-subunit alcohol dehydrogenase family)
MFNFTDNVAMVTGASGNLGSAVAHAFRDAGARIAVIDRDKEGLEREFPTIIDSPDCFMSGCADLTDPEEVNGVVADTVERFGRIDILVNTVGGFRAGLPLHETPLETLEFMFTLNARTAFITSQVVIPHMLQQGSGKVIHLAARPGLAGRANMSAYSASKAAVIRFVESAAAEVREQGINVNCILPGTLDTPQNRQAMPKADFSRWVRPESLARVILFLASDAAGDIHGAALPVYGLS